MKESFVGMKVQEEMKVLKNELEMSVAPISRLTKRAYLRLCPEKRRKIEFGPYRVKENENFQIKLTL